MKSSATGAGAAEASEKLSFGEGNGGLCIRLLFLLLALVSFACALASMSQCRFLTYEPRIPPVGVMDTRPLNVTIADIGIYRYDPDLEGCREIPDSVDKSGSYKAVRVGAAFTILCASTAIFMVLIELACCRFPFSKTLISTFFIFAAGFQSLTFLLYNAPICDPNYVDGPFPCSPAPGTWFATVAVVLFASLCIVSCCIPQPVPIFYRVQKNSTTDRCCAFLGRKPAEEPDEVLEEPNEMVEFHDEEAVAVPPPVPIASTTTKSLNAKQSKATSPGSTTQSLAASRHSTTPPAAPAPPTAVVDPVEQKVRDQKAHLEITNALVQLRRDKHEEIERQLSLLTTYKDALPEEVYAERMQKLMMALPDPGTYDAYTSTTVLNDLPVPVVNGGTNTSQATTTEEAGSSDKISDDGGSGDNGEEPLLDLGEQDTPAREEEKMGDNAVETRAKKSMGSKIVSSVASTMSSVKSKVVPGKKTSTEPDVKSKVLGVGSIDGSFAPAPGAEE